MLILTNSYGLRAIDVVFLGAVVCVKDLFIVLTAGVVGHDTVDDAFDHVAIAVVEVGGLLKQRGGGFADCRVGQDGRGGHAGRWRWRRGWSGRARC